jgi:hypothetical protein
MADQELTALKIRIEAEVADAVNQLQKVAEKVVVVENQVRTSVGKINASLKSINTKFKIDIDVTGFNSIPAKAKEGVEQAKRNIRSLTNITLDKIPVGFRVSLDDLLEAKRELIKQRLSVESDIDTAPFNNKIALIESEIKRRRSILVTGDVDLSATITKLKEQLNDLQAQRAIVSVSADATGLDKLDDQVEFIQARLAALDAIEIDPRVSRQSLDAFVAGVKNGFDVTAAELVAFKSKADGLLNFAIGIDKSDLNNISTYLGDQIRKAESVSEIKLQIDQGNANAIFESIKSGAERSVPVVKELSKVLKQLQERYKIEFGLDSAQYKDVSDKLLFIEGQKKILEREVKITFNSNAVTELKTNLNNLPKSVVLNAVASFNGQQFNDLLNDIKNKNVNLTVTDIADQLKAQIAELEALNPSIDVDADTSKYKSKIDTLKGQLGQVEAIQVNANTAPAELSLKQLVSRAQSILANQAELKIRTQIVLPSAELSALNQTKKRLEADKIRLKGTAEFGDIVANLESVKRRVADLNKAGVKVQVTSGELISQRSVESVKTTLQVVKDLKKQSGQIRIDVDASGLQNAQKSAAQVARNFEQIIRDAPSFAYGIQPGLIAISNNIGPLQDSLLQLGIAAKTANVSMGQLIKGALSGWGGVVLGISVAVSLVTAFSGKLFGASKEAEELEEILKNVRDTLKEVSIINPLAAAGQEDNIQRINLLTAAVLDLSNSETVRKNALQSLKNFNEEVYGKYDLYSASTNSLKKSTEDLVKVLVAQAIVEDKLQKIKDIALDKVRIKSKIDEAQANRDLAKSAFDAAKLNSTPTGSRNTIGGGVDLSSSIDVSSLKNDLNAAQKVLDNYLLQYGRQISTSVKLKQELATEIEEALGLLAFGGNPNGGGAGGDDRLKNLLESRKRVLESELANISEISKRAFEIQSEIAGLDLRIANIGEADKEIKFNNFQEYQNVLRGISIEANKARVELKNIILTLTDPTFFEGVNIRPFVEIREEVIKTKQEIESLFRSGAIDVDQKIQFKAEAEFKADQEVLKIQKELDSYTLLIKSGIAPQLTPVVPDQSIAPLQEAFDFEKNIKETQDELNRVNTIVQNGYKPLEDYVKKLGELNDQFAQILAAGVGQLFEDVFSLAAEGELTFKTLGESVVKFTQDLIKAILKLVIMQSILKALNISTPIGAGTGGGFNFLEFLFRGFKAKKFATGGIVTGPTFGMVGEAGPEAVLPLSYLNNLVASIGGSANLQARVSGQDLLFVMERAGRVNNRTF